MPTTTKSVVSLTSPMSLVADVTRRDAIERHPILIYKIPPDMDVVNNRFFTSNHRVKEQRTFDGKDEQMLDV